MAKEKNHFGRWLLSVVIAVVAAALILYGVTQLALSSSLSRKNMRALAETVRIEEVADRPTLVRIVNTVIYKWTNAFSSSSIYATEATLPTYYDEAEVKDALGNVYAQVGRSLKTGKPTDITAKDLLPAMGRLRGCIGEKLGVQITDEMCLEELEGAVDVRSLNRTYPKIVRVWLGIILIAVAVLLLAVMLFVRRENLFMGGFYLTLSFGIPGVVLFISSLSLSTLPRALSSFLPEEAWLMIIKKCLRTTGAACFIAAALGVVLMIAYLVDRRRVKKLTAHRRKEEDLL